MTDLKRLFRMKKNEIRMMKNRGYSMDNSQLLDIDNRFQKWNPMQFLDFTWDQFMKYRKDTGYMRVREEFSALYHKQNGEPVLFIYLRNEGDKIVKSTFNRQVKELIITKKYHHFILITETELGSDNTSFFTDRLDGYKYEKYNDYHFAFNYLEHALSPLSVKYIAPEETKQFIKEERLKSFNSLPIIKEDDTVARWAGAENHGVLLMKQIGAIYDETIFYRGVR